MRLNAGNAPTWDGRQGPRSGQRLASDALAMAHRLNCCVRSCHCHRRGSRTPDAQDEDCADRPDTWHLAPGIAAWQIKMISGSRPARLTKFTGAGRRRALQGRRRDLRSRGRVVSRPLRALRSLRGHFASRTANHDRRGPAGPEWFLYPCAPATLQPGALPSLGWLTTRECKRAPL